MAANLSPRIDNAVRKGRPTMNRILAFAFALALSFSLALPGFVATATVANASCNNSSCE